MALSREFYRPKKYTAKIVPKGVLAEVYLVDGVKHPVAVMFGGRRSKPDHHSAYYSEEQRAEAVKIYLDRMIERAADQVSEKSFNHTLEVGSILYSSWGYDQTNVDYYEVTEVVGKKSVRIKKIESKKVSTSDDNYKSSAYPGEFKSEGEGMLKRVKEGNIISLNSYSSAYPWDGRPKYETGPYNGH